MDLMRKQVIDNLSYIMDSMPDDTCAEWRDSLAYAISDMKKLEEIEQIVGDRYGKPTFKFMDEIVKVVEDRNVYSDGA